MEGYLKQLLLEVSRSDRNSKFKILKRGGLWRPSMAVTAFEKLACCLLDRKLFHNTGFLCAMCMIGSIDVLICKEIDQFYVSRDERVPETIC